MCRHAHAFSHMKSAAADTRLGGRDVEADGHVVYKSSFFGKEDSGGRVRVVSRNLQFCQGFLCVCLMLLQKSPG